MLSLSVSTILPLIAVSGLLVVFGFGVGWWLRSARRTTDATVEILSRRLADALGRLQMIAGDISNGTSLHAEEVDAVNKRLGSTPQGDVDSLHQALLQGMTQIISANDRLQNHLNEVETKLEEQARQIDLQLAEARLDGLTGTNNRKSFDEELTRRMAEWRRRQTPISLLMIDVDHFKKINDRHGHPAGDAVLREIARVLQATMREMDFVARYGGEEFAVILPSTVLRDARRAAERALEAVAGHRFAVDDGELDVTVSVGLAEAMPGDDAATLVRRADEALYLSKAAGRNCGHFHSGADCIALDSPRIMDAMIAPWTLPIDPIRIARPETPAAEPAGRPSVAESQTSEGIDALTELPAAGAFSNELRRRIQRCRHEDRRLTLLLVDVDRLTSINSRIGRDAGDYLLRHTADVLRRECREGDYLARYHQGQFALTLHDVDLDAAIATAERIRSAVQVAQPIPGDLIPDVSVSCGLAELAPGDRAVSLVMRANVALSAAKSAGRDCVFVHDGQTAEPADERVTR
jgi:diguanylate cyclase